jgi:F-type H+-transporting ATPase subunit c
MLTPILAQVGQAGEVAVEAAKTVGISGSIHVGLAALGAAIGVGLIGMKASEAVGRNPGAATPILVQAILSTAFAEGIVFFAIYLVR